MSSGKDTAADAPSADASKQKAPVKARKPLPGLPAHRRHLEFIRTPDEDEAPVTLAAPVAAVAAVAPIAPVVQAAAGPAQTTAPAQGTVNARPARPSARAARRARAARNYLCQICAHVSKTKNARDAHRRNKHGMVCRWPGCGQTIYGPLTAFLLHLRDHNNRAAHHGGNNAVCYWPGCNWDGVLPKNLEKHLHDHSTGKYQNI
ncbi:hypothetical protein F4820DRAFT_449399 [Hypoxylon rubiginosum]|uniref:Uncharacterized protein n=1 Tax=Hypoxylon rubiginosum TaxID=110542 RepID=A0ACB9YYP3_9PEZI|nr:hypothetical protein F4820DRAFT_449399 [Hypoxylon rubiginosum]